MSDEKGTAVKAVSPNAALPQEQRHTRVQRPARPGSKREKRLW
jgi:hypothetical protein